MKQTVSSAWNKMPQIRYSYSSCQKKTAKIIFRMQTNFEAPHFKMQRADFQALSKFYS